LTDAEKLALTMGFLIEFFHEEPEKVGHWLDTENLMLGGCKPLFMIKAGRISKLYKFIETAKQENENSENV